MRKLIKPLVFLAALALGCVDDVTPTAVEEVAAVAVDGIPATNNKIILLK